MAVEKRRAQKEIALPGTPDPEMAPDLNDAVAGHGNSFGNAPIGSLLSGTIMAAAVVLCLTSRLCARTSNRTSQHSIAPAKSAHETLRYCRFYLQLLYATVCER
jgi:hypothetical protein